MASPDPLDPHGMKRRGVLFVLSSPSGAGKSTIARKLLAAEPDLQMSVSATTRPPREGEVDGRDYHFVDLERFRAMVAEHAFLEWAHVFDHRYGTPKAQVEEILASGRDVLFDIDWQGAQQLHQIAGGDVVRVFVLPPSMTELRRRLEGLDAAWSEPSARSKKSRCASALASLSAKSTVSALAATGPRKKPATRPISRFGSTPCKAQWRCRACLEPFDRFKCH